MFFIGRLPLEKRKKKETQAHNTLGTELGAVSERIWMSKVVQTSIKARSDFRLDLYLLMDFGGKDQQLNNKQQQQQQALKIKD
jgi:hypothetical protein